MTDNASIAAKSENRPESFQLKGGLFPMTLLELRSPILEDIAGELQKKISQSPDFFKHSPIVFGFDKLNEPEQNIIDLPALVSLCQSLDLIPAATRGGNQHVKSQSLQHGLAHIPSGRIKAVETDIAAKETSVEKNLPRENLAEKSYGKIISHPVRSGQQVYAPGENLIVLSSVSPGAEVIADGNVHVYGALRGKALAGVKGNCNARIFCSRQEAELVSIAGEYLVGDTLKQTHWRESVQIFLEKDNIVIKALT